MNGSWSAWQTFTVDTTAPATSKISSTDFPAGPVVRHPGRQRQLHRRLHLHPARQRREGHPVGAGRRCLDHGRHHRRRRHPLADLRRRRAHPEGAHPGRSGQHLRRDRLHLLRGLAAPRCSPRARATARPAAWTVRPGQGEPHRGRYQYRRGETDTWKDVPVADVPQGVRRLRRPALAGAGHRRASRPRLTWNITDTFAEDGAGGRAAGFTDGSGTRRLPGHHTITVDRDAGDAPPT